MLARRTSRVAIVIVPVANMAGTISIGPSQQTAAALAAHAARDHLKAFIKVPFVVVGSSSDSRTPAAKPAAVTGGASSHRPSLSEKCMSAVKAVMAAAIQQP